MAGIGVAAGTISLPSRTALFTQDDEAGYVYLVCAGYLKLIARPTDEREVIVRLAGPGSVLGLSAVLSNGTYEVSAQSLTMAQLRSIERERFLNFLRNHREAQMLAAHCICQEYRIALRDICRIVGCETVAARLGQLLLELANQIGEPLESGVIRFPLLLTHEEMASMTLTTRETVTRAIGHFRNDGWISIEHGHVSINQPEKLRFADSLLPAFR